MPRRPTWRYAAGTKRVNRVTVYERRDRPCLYIEYQDGYGQRIQRPLEGHTGIPVPNTTEGRDLAVKIAEAVAVERPANESSDSTLHAAGRTTHEPEEGQR